MDDPYGSQLFIFVIFLIFEYLNSIPSFSLPILKSKLFYWNYSWIIYSKNMEYWKNQWKNSFEIPFLFLDGHLSGDFKETNKL